MSSSVVVSTKGSVLDKSLSDIIKESKKTAAKPKPKPKPKGATAAAKPKPKTAAAGAKPKPAAKKPTGAAGAATRKKPQESYEAPAVRQRRLPGRGKDDADARRRESLEKYTLAASKAKRQDAISKARGLAPSKTPLPKRSDFTTAPSGAPKRAPKPEKIQITIQNDVVAPPPAAAKPKATKPKVVPSTTVVKTAAKPKALKLSAPAPKPKAIKTTATGIVQPDPKNFERQKEMVKQARGAETAAAVVTKKKAAPTTLSQRFASR